MLLTLAVRWLPRTLFISKQTQAAAPDLLGLAAR